MPYCEPDSSKLVVLPPHTSEVVGLKVKAAVGGLQVTITGSDKLLSQPFGGVKVAVTVAPANRSCADSPSTPQVVPDIKTGVGNGVPSMYSVIWAPAADAGAVPVMVVAPSVIGSTVSTPSGPGAAVTTLEFTLETLPADTALAVIVVPAAMPPAVVDVKLATQAPVLVTVAVTGVVPSLCVTSVPVLVPAVPPV